MEKSNQDNSIEEITNRRAFGVYGEPGSQVYEDISFLLNERNQIHIPSHQDLTNTIFEYTKGIWIGDPDDIQGMFINSWVLVINIGDIDTPYAGDYVVEMYPECSPPHAVKGLLREGLEEYIHMENGED